MADPISVEDALRAVLAHVTPLGSETVDLFDALDRVLAEAVAADRPYPPFRKSRVDGFAVRAADAGLGGARLPVAFEVPAGRVPGDVLPPGSAARVFTGAPVPGGADTMVMQERCTLDGDHVTLPGALRVGDHVVEQGAEWPAGRDVAGPGDPIGPACVGALASVGAHRVSVRVRPRVHVVATGSELVPIDAPVGPGEIRNSNAAALAAAACRLGGVVLGVHRAVDTEAAHREALARALEADVVLVTGGVSVGDYDLVPAVLADLGVRCVFHGVRLQPGKPLWFGVRGETLVFGLPGNPVSSLVNTELFVRPALRRAVGLEPAVDPPLRARLITALGGGTWRRRYLPARLGLDDHGAPTVAALPWAGSGDVFGFSRANALVVVDEHAPPRAAGEPADVVTLRTVGP